MKIGTKQIPIPQIQSNIKCSYKNPKNKPIYTSLNTIGYKKFKKSLENRLLILITESKPIFNKIAWFEKKKKYQNYTQYVA